MTDTEQTSFNTSSSIYGNEMRTFLKSRNKWMCFTIFIIFADFASSLGIIYRIYNYSNEHKFGDLSSIIEGAIVSVFYISYEVLIVLRNYKVEMLCVLYYGITSYAYLIFCFVRCIIKYLQPKNNNKNDDDRSFDIINILLLIIITIYRAGIIYSIKKYGNAIQKVDNYHRNEKQEKFITSIETKIGTIEGGSFNWN